MESILKEVAKETLLTAGKTFAIIVGIKVALKVCDKLSEETKDIENI